MEVGPYTLACWLCPFSPVRPVKLSQSSLFGILTDLNNNKQQKHQSAMKNMPSRVVWIDHFDFHDPSTVF